MTVKWEQFAKRRSINLEMFSSLDYDEFKSWCQFRKVEPVSEETFLSIKNLPAPTKLEVSNSEPIVDTQEEVHAEIDIEKLNKMRKNQILAYCKKNNISVSSKSTKKQLVNKLISLNNS